MPNSTIPYRSKALHRTCAAYYNPPDKAKTYPFMSIIILLSALPLRPYQKNGDVCSREEIGWSSNIVCSSHHFAAEQSFPVLLIQFPKHACFNAISRDETYDTCEHTSKMDLPNLGTQSLMRGTNEAMVKSALNITNERNILEITPFKTSGYFKTTFGWGSTLNELLGLGFISAKVSFPFSVLGDKNKQITVNYLENGYLNNM